MDASRDIASLYNVTGDPGVLYLAPYLSGTGLVTSCFRQDKGFL
jgi:hypothetical protein